MTLPIQNDTPFRSEESGERLPSILLGSEAPETIRRVEGFYKSLAAIFEAWVARCESPHTRRAYRQDVMSLIAFLNIRWPDDSLRMLTVTIADVQDWRSAMLGRGAAPKTLNRRISSVSSFYKFVQASAAELRLPITVPNPAHAQFIARSSTDPVHETKALSATRARQLMSLPQDNTLVASRDRAILKTYLYSGVRLATACSLNVGDFHQDGEEATLRLKEKGNHHRTIGLHFNAASAIQEYMDTAFITRGPLFRPQQGTSPNQLAERHLTPTSMYRIVRGYLEQLPSFVSDDRCLFSTHSLRATTATLLLEAGVDIRKVQELLGHRHVTTTQIYDKRRRGTKESASHDVPI